MKKFSKINTDVPQCGAEKLIVELSRQLISATEGYSGQVILSSLCSFVTTILCHFDPEVQEELHKDILETLKASLDKFRRTNSDPVH